MQVQGKVPVLIGRWTEEQERVILATLDPLASMAEANEGALHELLEHLDAESLGLEALFSDLEKIAAPEKGAAEPDLENPKYSYEAQYGVIVVCKDEAHQQSVYEDLSERGYECKVVVV